MSSLPAPTLGTHLKRYRRAAGWTQEALAERAGISADTISELERGVNLRPRRDTIDRLADALALTPAERAQLQAAARGLLPPGGAAVVPLRLPTANASQPPLVGREQELGRLARHLRGEGPPLLLLAGEPGIGKSRLLSEGVQQAQAQGWTVLEGGCHRKSGQEPFTPLLSALADSLRQAAPAALRTHLEGCAWLVRLLPELAEARLVPAPSWTLPPGQERRLMFAAVARYLANVAGPLGTLLVLDDLQWVGADALDLLASLLRAHGAPSLRVLGAYRSTEAGPTDPLGVVLADLGASGLASEYQVGPLASPEARALLRDMLEERPEVDEVLRAQLLARTGGVPYFLVSCAQALRAETLEEAPLRVPWNVAQSIRQRVALLPQAAQEVLGAAAVVGRAIPGTLLLAVAARPTAEVMATLDALDRARLLVEGTQARYQFSHDLIREVVLSDLSALRRRHWHRQLAEALEQQPGEPPLEQLAYHSVQAGEDDKAILYLERAGDRAVALFAHVEAEGYYRNLVAHVERLGSLLQMAAAYAKWAGMLKTIGRLDEALAAFLRAEATFRAAGDHERRWLMLAAAVDLHGMLGATSEGLVLLRPVLEMIEPREPSPGLAALHLAASTLYWWLGQFREALAAAEQAVEVAQAVRDESLLLRAQHFYGITLFWSGQIEEARRVWGGLLSLAERLRELWFLSDLLVRIAMTYRVLGEFTQGRSPHDQAVEVAERLGDPVGVAIALFGRGQMYFFSGDWSAARQDTERARAMLRPIRGNRFTCDPLIALGELALAEGREEEGVSLLEEGIQLAEQYQHFNRQVLGELALCEWEVLKGRAQAGHSRLESLRSHSSLREPELEQLRPMLAWVAVLLGEEKQAETWLVEGIARATPRTRVNLLRFQALLRIEQKCWEEAKAALEEALALCRKMPYPYAEAKALYVFGQLHLAKGEPAHARERLEAALTILNRLDERLYAEQIESLLALQGIAAPLLPEQALAARGRARNPTPPQPGLLVASPLTRKAIKSTFSGLTEREREVAQLVALGKTNREIAEGLVVHYRTVEKHIENMLAKLGFTSRTQIAVWASEKGLGKPDGRDR